MRRPSAQEQARIGAFVMAAGTMVYIVSMYVIGPSWRKARELGDRIKQVAEQVRGLEAVTAGLQTVEQQHAVLDRKVAALQKGLPAETELPAIIELLSEFAGQTSVRIQTIFPQRSPAEESLGRTNAAQPAMYKTIPVQIDALAGFHQLGAFLSLVETHAKPLRIASLRISGQQKDAQWHRVKLVIDSYVTAPSVQP